MSRAFPGDFFRITGDSNQAHLAGHKHLESALESYYSEQRRPDLSVHVGKIGVLFDRYKEPGTDEIAVGGTLAFCKELGVDPEDAVLLAVAYELKSPSVGQWTRAGWIEGWRHLGCDTLDAIKAVLPRLRTEFGSDPSYFRAVYSHTFTLARTEGQRSLAIDTALAYWELLLPFGLAGGALKHTRPSRSSSVGPCGAPCAHRPHPQMHQQAYVQAQARPRNRVRGVAAQNHMHDPECDVDMDASVTQGGQDANALQAKEIDEGWGARHTVWWIEYIKLRSDRGVSKDAWQMLVEFIPTVDAKFENHDATAAWPSTIDDFVVWAKEHKLSNSSA